MKKSLNFISFGLLLALGVFSASASYAGPEEDAANDLLAAMNFVSVTRFTDPATLLYQYVLEKNLKYDAMDEKEFAKKPAKVAAFRSALQLANEEFRLIQHERALGYRRGVGITRRQHELENILLGLVTQYSENPPNEVVRAAERIVSERGFAEGTHGADLQVKLAQAIFAKLRLNGVHDDVLVHNLTRASEPQVSEEEEKYVVIVTPPSELSVYENVPSLTSSKSAR